MRRAAPLIVLLLAGCGNGAAAPETRTTPPDQTPVASGGACQQYIPKEPLAAPKGLIEPPGQLIVGKVTRVAPQVRVEGFIAGQPAGVRNFFLKSRYVKVSFSEDEGFEAEALVSDGRWRNFWKVARACDRGSVFAAIVVREEKPFKVRPEK
jgi:hypothetical protein